MKRANRYPALQLMTGAGTLLRVTMLALQFAVLKPRPVMLNGVIPLYRSSQASEALRQVKFMRRRSAQEYCGTCWQR